MSLLRYIGKTNKGPNGEILYPGNDNPDLIYFIDSRLTIDADLMSKFNSFLLPFVPSYKNKDEHFTNFIIADFPAYLEKFEETLSKNGGPYLSGKDINIADFSAFGFFFKLVLNEQFEHYLILTAILSKYPKTKAYVENAANMFADWRSKN